MKRKITLEKLSDLTPEELLNEFPYTEKNEKLIKTLFDDTNIDDEDFFEECYKIAKMQLLNEIPISEEILEKNFGRARGVGWYSVYFVREDEFDENDFPTKYIGIRDAFPCYPKKERFAIIQNDKENVICNVKTIWDLYWALEKLGVAIDLKLS